MLVFDHQGNLLKNLRSERSLAQFTFPDRKKQSMPRLKNRKWRSYGLILVTF